MADPRWTIVVPVKGTSSAKSRLGAGRFLADSIALDTVTAAIGSGSRVVVVTPAGSQVFSSLDVTLVDDPGAGLAAAVSVGIETSGSGACAVLLGDLPALTAEELSTALSSATRHHRAFVPDAEGLGTTLITALDGANHTPRFGRESARMHLREGYLQLEVDANSGLRRDVDTPADLAGLVGRLGPATEAVLGDAN